MLIREAYIFIPLAGQDTAAATIAHHQESAGVNRYYFCYGRRYLEHPEAYSIDPRELPLSPKIMVFNELPSAIQDNGPDDFGRYLYERLHGTPPESPLDFHLKNGNHGTGALVFSATLTPPISQPLGIHLTSINALREALEHIDQKKAIPPELEVLLNPGTSLGGARPKALVEDEQGDQWIVKINRANDIFDIAIAEHAAMQAAKHAGIRSAESKILSSGNTHVYLTKRFDRINGARKHFLSAFTLMGANKNTASEQFYDTYSYSNLSHMLKRVSSSPAEDRIELFTRMAFNVIAGNRDDHLKNHGFIKDENGPLYRLSLAYDIVPGAASNHQAIGVGTSGAAATLQNILSRYSDFGLDLSQAQNIVDRVNEAVSTIPLIAESHGMGLEDIKILSGRLLVD